MPVLSQLPDGRQVQRLDTTGWDHDKMVGQKVFHPLLQVGGVPAWSSDQVRELEERIGFSIDEHLEEDLEEYTWDEGFLREVFNDPWSDGTSHFRARFSENSEEHGFNYALDNLWVEVT